MNVKHRLVLSAVVLWGVLVGVGVVGPLSASAQTPAAPPTTDYCNKQIAALESATGLDEVAKAAAIGMYRDAIEQLTKAAGFAQDTAEYQRLASEAPQLLTTIRAELAQPPAEPAVSVPPDATLGQLEQQLQQATATLKAAQQKVADLQAEAARRDAQHPALSERLIQLRQDLANLTEVAPPDGSGGPSSTPTEVLEAQAAQRRATALAYQAEIDAIEAELASYDARRELLPARLDRAQRRVTEAQKLVAAWQGLVAARRKADAEHAAQEALRLRKEAARQSPALKAFAQETVVMADARVKAQNAHNGPESSGQQLVRAKTELADLSSSFASMQNRLSVSGLNRATGLLLRRQYETLPRINRYKDELRAAQDALENIDYKLIELQEERASFGDIDQAAQVLLASMPENTMATSRADLLPVARELVTARRDLLDQLIGDASQAFDTQVELIATLQEFVTTATAYKTFIEERILWVRSIAGDRALRLSDLENGVLWFCDPSGWGRAWGRTTTFVRLRLVDVGAAVSFLLLLSLVSFRSRRWLNTLGEWVSRYSTDSFRYTLAALLLTAIMSVPFAGAMFVLGWILKAPQDQEPVAAAMGQGLQVAAMSMYPLAFLRHLLRPRGLALGHFRWSKDAAEPMRRNLRWFTPTIVPVILLVAAIDSGGDEASNASLGRVLFSLGILLLTVFLHRVLRPTGPVLKRFIDANSAEWIYRLRYVWYLSAVILPFAFMVLGWMGFYYTAIQLQSRLEQSLVFVLVLVVANSTLHRWLYIARRRVVVEGARRRRAQAELEAKAAPESAEAPAPIPAIVDEEKVDLPALSEQTTQIFKTAVTIAAVIGLYIIWAQALPALRMLDRVQVWPTIQLVEAGVTPTASQSAAAISTATPTQGDSTGGSSLLMPGSGLAQADTTASGNEATESVSITLADIGLSLVILMTTWIAFRNVPGLMEIVVLQRLPLDAGSRYALSTVLRYLVAMVGIAIACRASGVSWSHVQWLAAALTFGLAFGLQEIFANFVSGLIILAERPIRLGDTITVGGVTGTVMRIRMRATTIADWDRKELVIPNKTFITGDIINWTLSDSILRVQIQVGVSYSSDVDLVERLLQDISESEGNVLADPAPSVLFKGFGDSTLDFVLRVYIPNLGCYFTVINDLHSTIYKRFKQEGIEIAFPQRDLHLRSIGDLEKLMDHGNQSQPAQ